MLEKGKTYRVLKPEMVVVVVKDWGEVGWYELSFCVCLLIAWKNVLYKIPNPEMDSIHSA